MMPKDVIASDSQPAYFCVLIFIVYFNLFQIARSLAFVDSGQLPLQFWRQFRWRRLFNRLVIPNVGSRLPVHRIFQLENDQTYGRYHGISLYRFCCCICESGERMDHMSFGLGLMSL